MVGSSRHTWDTDRPPREWMAASSFLLYPCGLLTRGSHRRLAAPKLTMGNGFLTPSAPCPCVASQLSCHSAAEQRSDVYLTHTSTLPYLHADIPRWRMCVCVYHICLSVSPRRLLAELLRPLSERALSERTIVRRDGRTWQMQRRSHAARCIPVV